FAPKKTVLGTELAGVVEAVGRGVTRFRPGDRVFAAPADGTGAHAEYICLPENGAVCAMPDNLSAEQAAAICNGALTALPFLRDSGKVRRGSKVLVIGASGSIGTFAVQLAKHFGADVTAVCSAANIELVRSLGADRAIDYTREDFTASGETWDIIFDTVAKSSFARCRRSLRKRGVYLVTAPSLATMFHMARSAIFGGRRAVMSATGLRPAEDQRRDMVFIKGLVEAGTLTPVIDRSYPLERIAEAHRYVGKGHKIGNVVITANT
ncbi:MAG: NAD(P)-dependent alcohol dehydrogenase, partial [Paracoccaceae bacterium]